MAWGRSGAFRSLFGDVDAPYLVPDTVEVEFGNPRFSPRPAGFASHYGQYHPLEDFAETFRFYVLRGGHLADLHAEAARTRKHGLVAERFRMLDDYLRTLAAGSRS
jgi:hypothetical protein